MERKRQKGRIPPPRPTVVDQPADVDRDIAEIFGGVGTEPLTDAVVAELVANGWPEDDLRTAQQQGAQYNRRRNSLLF